MRSSAIDTVPVGVLPVQYVAVGKSYFTVYSGSALPHIDGHTDRKLPRSADKSLETHLRRLSDWNLDRELERLDFGERSDYQPV